MQENGECERKAEENEGDICKESEREIEKVNKEKENNLVLKKE